MATRFFEVPILPADGGFGLYTAYSCTDGDGWDFKHELLVEITAALDSDLYRLGVDALPDGLEDITGRIQNEPTEVYGWVDDDGYPRYLGIVCLEV